MASGYDNLHLAQRLCCIAGLLRDYACAGRPCKRNGSLEHLPSVHMREIVEDAVGTRPCCFSQ
jgi:hypothetical protein